MPALARPRTADVQESRVWVSQGLRMFGFVFANIASRWHISTDVLYLENNITIRESSNCCDLQNRRPQVNPPKQTPRPFVDEGAWAKFLRQARHFDQCLSWLHLGFWTVLLLSRVECFLHPCPFLRWSWLRMQRSEKWLTTSSVHSLSASSMFGFRASRFLWGLVEGVPKPQPSPIHPKLLGKVIHEATDSANLCRMFYGWSPWL